MQAQAVIFEKPRSLVVGSTSLTNDSESEIVVETLWSGISTGTERLLWEGRMPQFPGLGYPLVPGYESVGRIVDASNDNKARVGEMVFVPGCSAYKEVKGLFGGSASHLVVEGSKALKIDEALGSDAVLLALAATAYRAINSRKDMLPDLIVGNGVLGRLAARLVVALGGKPPVVWENNALRHMADDGVKVLHPSDDKDSKYNTILDMSGNSEILDQLVWHLNMGGEVILAGFYSSRLDFAFPAAFMKEATFRISAEWKPSDLANVYEMVEAEKVSLAGLITHKTGYQQAQTAYETAFSDPECLKMILDWKA